MNFAFWKKRVPAEASAAKKFGGIELPLAGRSSEGPGESLYGQIASFVGQYALDVNTLVSILDFLEIASIVNFDISQAVNKWVTLGNTGHDLVIEDVSEGRIEAARDRLNKLASSIYPRSAGMDGLVNFFLRQLAVTGAISAEDVLTEKLDAVDRVEPVPVRSIRLVPEEGCYVPCQVASSLFSGAERMSGQQNLIRLNPLTYHYYACEVGDRSPYAIPPMAAAIETSLLQHDMMDNLKFIFRKIGMLGLISIKVLPPPKKLGDSEKEYQACVNKYLQDTATSLAANYRKGVLVYCQDMELQHFNVAGAGAAGAKQLAEMVETFLLSGAKIDPALVGRTYSTTETYAVVVYSALCSQIENYLRLIKRRIEATYKLDLMLAGIEVEWVGVQFNPTPSLRPNIEELAETYKVGNVIRKMDKGIIDPDQAARELGYDQAADPERALAAPSGGFGSFQRGPARAGGARAVPAKRITFRFNRARQRYEFNRPRVRVRLEKPDADEAKWISDYLGEVAPAATEAGEQAAQAVSDYLAETPLESFADEKDFSGKIYPIVQEHYGSALSEASVSAGVKKSIESAYSFYRLTDKSIWDGGNPPVTMAFDPVDTRAIQALSDHDLQFVSGFVNNETMTEPVKNFLEQEFLNKGKGIYGPMDPDTIADFRLLFDDCLSELTDAEVKRIVNTTVTRSRTWGHIGQLAQSGWAEAEVVNGSDPCDFCAAKNGTTFSLAKARARVEELSAMSAEEFIESIKANADAAEFPPFHPNCHCRLRASSGGR